MSDRSTDRGQKEKRDKERRDRSRRVRIGRHRTKNTSPLPSLVDSSGEESEGEDSDDDDEQNHNDSEDVKVTDASENKKKPILNKTYETREKNGSGLTKEEMINCLHRVRQIRKLGEGGSNQTPTMQGLISTKMGKRFLDTSFPETFVPDTGSTVTVIPLEVAKEHRMFIEKIDSEEANLTDASGGTMSVVGKATFFVQFECFPSPKQVTGLVVSK